MKWAVTAQAKSRTTGELIGKKRTEIINTSTNVLFSKAKDKAQVKERYEAFWNDLNPDSEEVVYVDNIKRKQGDE